MIEKELVTLLEKNNLTIGSVESYTGGLFAATITGVPGASKVFPGSIVTYANEIKEKLVGVKEITIHQYGVVSKEVAQEMADGGREKLGVDICVSFTGNAGPTALDRLPVGRVVIGISTKPKTMLYELQLDNCDRNRIREISVEQAMKWVMEYIRTNE